MLHGTAEAGNGGSLAWAPVLAVAAVLALVCWRVVTLAVADFYLASGAPQDALSWRASHPTALIQLAEGRLIAHDREEAAARALAALAAAPIGGGGYRILGQVAVEQSAPVRAEQMMALAVARDPRDVVARLWLAHQAIKKNDAGAAIAQFDRVMRVAPDAQPKIFPVLALFAAVPSAVPALADNLAQRRFRLMGHIILSQCHACRCLRNLERCRLRSHTHRPACRNDQDRDGNPSAHAFLCGNPVHVVLTRWDQEERKQRLATLPPPGRLCRFTSAALQSCLRPASPNRTCRVRI